MFALREGWRNGLSHRHGHGIVSCASPPMRFCYALLENGLFIPQQQLGPVLYMPIGGKNLAGLEHGYARVLHSAQLAQI